MRPIVARLFRPAAALLAALAVGFVFLLLSGKDALQAYEVLLTAPITRLARAGRWLEASSVYILAGLAILTPYRARMLNFGLVAQTAAGAVAAYATFVLVQWPDPLALIAASLAAAVAGALVACIPGWLKAYLGANEILTGLMLNPIVDGLLAIGVDPLFRLVGWLGAARTQERGEAFGFAKIADISMLDTGTLHTGLLLTPLACLAIWLLFSRTPLGYEIRMAGASENFARYGGIPVRRAIVLAFALGGACAGLAGAHMALGHPGDLYIATQGLTFDGITVALIAQANPLAAPVAGLLYGYLVVGADYMEIRTSTGQELIRIVQGLVVLFAIVRVWRIQSARGHARKRDRDGGKHANG